jgi:probable biosynthetic protein (TIGR04099 family)
MNRLLPSIEVRRLLSGPAVSSSMPQQITLGMPHLCMNGLSETWLVKECGHRHWSMLAAAAGLAAPDFRDPAGDPIYAAFLSVSIREAAFEQAHEHDRLLFNSRLARNSRTRFVSFHRLSVLGRPIGEIAMTSTFVRRAEKGRNHSVARIEVPTLREVEFNPEAAARTAEVAALRSNHWHRHLEFERSAARVIDRFIVDPCPSQDFNGADFLYFASYLAFVDRAEWAFFRPQAPFATTRRRDLIYRGNVDPGERVILTLLQFVRDAGSLGHWYRLEREPDSLVIGEAFTVRALRKS